MYEDRAIHKPGDEEGVGKRLLRDEQTGEPERPANDEAECQTLQKASHRAADIVEQFVVRYLEADIGNVPDHRKKDQDHDERENKPADIGYALAEHFYDGVDKLRVIFLRVGNGFVRHLLAGGFVNTHAVVGERAELRFASGILRKIVLDRKTGAVDSHGRADGFVYDVDLHKAAGERAQRVNDLPGIGQGEKIGTIHRNDKRDQAEDTHDEPLLIAGPDTENEYGQKQKTQYRFHAKPPLLDGIGKKLPVEIDLNNAGRAGEKRAAVRAEKRLPDVLRRLIGNDLLQRGGKERGFLSGEEDEKLAAAG